MPKSMSSFLQKKYKKNFEKNLDVVVGGLTKH